MRRASRTDTGAGTANRAAPARRWSAPAVAGVAGGAGGAAALGFGGLYAAGLLLAGEDIASGTEVRGVGTGGLSRAEAGRRLDRELGPAAAAPLGLRIGDRTEQAEPAALGLSLDTAATVDRAARADGGDGGGGDPLGLPVRRAEPRIGQQETGRALKELAEPAVSAPLTLTADGKRIPVGPAVLARHLSLKDDGSGRLAPTLDAKALLAEPAFADPLRRAVPRPAEAKLLLAGSGRVSVAEGREATVARGSLDLRFANDSGKALSIQAEATDTSITITFLGTKKYEEIRATRGPRTNVKQPATRTDSGPECEPRSPLEGFGVAVDRVFVQGGQEVERETMKTRYTPRDSITCG
ncbi:VanW family protein [Streptomyces sp. NRRL S-244]|uniref:VanW family protein n=1 Tax=Streptomyces sp. NRRL S-244 TaxID=1463897 RepID=UPI0004C26492|nr:VanW family protein [Streptomyces sp. NRRL S-244]